MASHKYKYTWRGRLILILGILISWLSTIQATLITGDSLSKRK